MKKTKIALLCALLVTLTGCTKQLTDDSKKVVQYNEETICNSCNYKCNLIEEEYNNLLNDESTVLDDEKVEEYKNKISACKSECESTCLVASKVQTGQNLVSNILCKPSDEYMQDVYKANGVDIDSLEACKDISVASGTYEGVWTSIFVKPLAWLIVKIGNIFNNYGISIIIITLIIRLILYPVTKKTALQSEMMKKAQPEIEKLEKKYAGLTDQNSQMQKSQELMLIYKKNNINPLSGCLFSLIQIPLFFAFYESLNRLPIINEGKFLCFNLGETPYLAIFTNGKIYYMLIVILVGAITYLSFKLNSTASMSKEQESQMKMMSIFSVVLITYMSFRVSVSIALYWIVNSAFTVVQNLLVKRGKKNDNII